MRWVSNPARTATLDCKENADSEGEQLLRPPTKGANYKDSDQAKNSNNRQ